MKKIDVNSSRSLRQKEGSTLIKKCLGKYGGCLVWYCAGFGKTYLCTDLINVDLMKKFSDARIDILVGTDYLLKQWKSRVKCGENVNTWQSVYKGDKNSIKTNLLIIDEAHTFLGTDEYIKALDVFDYEYVIFLTATARDEDLILLKELGYPVADQITYKEALSKEWVSDKITYNIKVDLPKRSSALINFYDSEIRTKLLYLDPSVEDPENYDGRESYGNLEKALVSVVSGIYDLKHKLILLEEEQTIQNLISNQKGNVYRYKSGKNIGKIKYKKDFPNAEKIAKVRNSTPQLVVGFASNIRGLYKKKHDLLYNNPNKIKTIEKLLEIFNNRRGFIFTMRSAECDKIVELNPNKLAPYHNSLPTIIEEYDFEKVYKTKPNVIITKTRKTSGKKQLEKIDLDFSDYKYDWLVSIRKIEAGADKPGVDMMINHSYTSKKHAYIQRFGRVTRKEGNKVAVIINLVSFHENGSQTKELHWLKKMLNVKEIECKTISEIWN